MRQLIGWLHSIHLNCRPDLCHSALCCQVLSIALNIRLQMIYMVYSALWGLVLPPSDYFLPRSPFPSRLLIILQIIQGSSLLQGLCANWSPFQGFSTLPSKPLSHFFFLLKKVLIILQGSAEMFLTLSLPQSRAPILFSLSKHLYFSCIALTNCSKIIICLFKVHLSRQSETYMRAETHVFIDQC